MPAMPEKDPLIGKVAPDFCLPNQEETSVCLHGYQGKWVVLYFYPRDNTPGCTLEAIQFNKEMEVFSGADAVIVGVSPDSPESHHKFQEKHGLGFVLLSDADHEVLKTYGVWKPKVLFGKELLGVERSTFLIDPSGVVVETWRKVKVSGHAAAILAVLKKHRTPP